MLHVLQLMTPHAVLQFLSDVVTHTPVQRTIWLRSNAIFVRAIKRVNYSFLH